MKRLLLFYFFYALAVVLDYCMGNVHDYSHNLALFGIDDALAAGLLIGGASLVGSTINGIIGSSNAKEANDTNVKLANQTANQQMEMFNRQMEFNLGESNKQYAYADKSWERQKQLYDQMWTQQTQYNDPKRQMLRYKDAGINPYFAMGNVSNGNVTSSFSPSDSVPSGSSAPSSPSLSAPTVQAYDPTAAFGQMQNGITSGVNAYLNGSKSLAESQNIAIQNITQLDRDLARLEESREQAINAHKSTEEIDERIKTTQKMREVTYQNAIKQGILFDEEARGKRQDIKNKRAEYDSIQLANERDRILNEVFPEIQQKQLRQLDATYKSTLAQAYSFWKSGELSVAQAATEAVNKLLVKAHQIGVSLENVYKPALYRSTLKQMQEHTRGLEWEANHPILSRTIGGVSSGVGAAAGAYVGGRVGKSAPVRPNPVRGFAP